MGEPLEAIDTLANAGIAREVTARQRAWAYFAVASLILIGIGCTPFAAIPLLQIPGYMTAFGSVMVVINILLAVLLFSKGVIEGRCDATRLGTAYLFVAVIFVPLVASYPGGVMPGSIIGTPLTAVWLWSFWHAGFALCVARYAWLAERPAQRVASPAIAVAAVTATCVGLTVVATTLLPYLPSTMADGHTLFSGIGGAIPVVILILIATALALVCRMPRQTHEQLWLAVAMVAALFDVWLTYRGAQRYSLGWYVSKLGSLFTSLAVFITLLHEIMLLHARAAAANGILTTMVHVDGLTGLYNRRRFDELIETEWRRGSREQQPISVLMIDVDLFKNYNDCYGHLEGDECLRQISVTLAWAVNRPGDSAARYGGEEFVVLLPSTDASGAIRVAERVRSRLRSLAIPHSASPLGRVTLSIGLATAVPGPEMTVNDLIAEADRGLYRAKRDGRDRASWAVERTIPTGLALIQGLSTDPIFE